MTLDQLLQAILPKYGTEIPRGTFLDGVNAVQDVIAQHLWLSNADLLRTSYEDTLDAETAQLTLPSGTLGLVDGEWPWLSNAELTPGRPLMPLPSWLRHTFTEMGQPRYFELRKLSLTVFPTPELESTVKLELFARPDALTALSDELAWDGMFDQVFVEAVPRFNVIGGMITVTAEVEAFIHQRVDLLVNHRPAKAIVWRYPA